MSWILGPSSIEKAAYLSDLFFNSRKFHAERIFSRKFDKYHSWMASRELSDLFESLEQSSYYSEGIFQFDSIKLQKFAERLEPAKAFSLFKEAQDGLEIFCDIEKHVPGAQSQFLAAWSLLECHCPWIAAVGRKVVKEIYPVRIRGGQYIGAGGATNHHLIGALFLSLRTAPHDIVKLAISFAHEIGHTVLMIMQQGDAIILEDPKVAVYSSVRRCNRPLIMSVHAAVASGYMIECSKLLLDSDKLSVGEQEYCERFISEQVDQLAQSLSDMKKFKFTEVGQKILHDLTKQTKMHSMQAL